MAVSLAACAGQVDTGAKGVLQWSHAAGDPETHTEAIPHTAAVPTFTALWAPSHLPPFSR